MLLVWQLLTAECEILREILKQRNQSAPSASLIGSLLVLQQILSTMCQSRAATEGNFQIGRVKMKPGWQFLLYILHEWWIFSILSAMFQYSVWKNPLLPLIGAKADEDNPTNCGDRGSKQNWPVAVWKHRGQENVQWSH